MESSKKLDAHLFICTNRKASGECCAVKGSEALRAEVKALCQDPARGWQGRVRVNASGCLGQCQEGIATVIYPQGLWHMGLTPESSETLLQALSAILD